MRRSLALIAVVFAALLFAPAAQGFVCWADSGNQTIGSGVDNNFITGITHPSGVAVTGSHIYWSSLTGPIGRANLDGTGQTPKLVEVAVEPCGLAVDSGHLYWVDEGSPSYIGRSGLDGSNPEHEYVKIPGTSFPCGVAVNSANIFWADIGFFGGGTRIGRASISGSGPDASFIGDGSLVLSGKGIRRVARQAKQAGKVNLGLKPNGAGKKALSSAGKLKVRVKVAFTPTGGTTLAKSKSFVLKQSPGH